MCLLVGDCSPSCRVLEGAEGMACDNGVLRVTRDERMDSRTVGSVIPCAVCFGYPIPGAVRRSGTVAFTLPLVFLSIIHEELFFEGYSAS